MKRVLTLLCLLFAINGLAEKRHSIEVIPFERAALLQSGDITHAEMTKNGIKAVLSLRLTEAAAHRMQEYTAKNVGRKLPFLVDGKVVATPVIRAAIKGGEFQVDALSPELAKEVTQTVNAGSNY